MVELLTQTCLCPSAGQCGGSLRTVWVCGHPDSRTPQGSRGDLDKWESWAAAAAALCMSAMPPAERRLSTAPHPDAEAPACLPTGHAHLHHTQTQPHTLWRQTYGWCECFVGPASGWADDGCGPASSGSPFCSAKQLPQPRYKKIISGAKINSTWSYTVTSREGEMDKETRKEKKEGKKGVREGKSK